MTQLREPAVAASPRRRPVLEMNPGSIAPQHRALVRARVTWAVNRSVGSARGVPDRLVTEAIDVFVSHDGHPGRAGERMARPSRLLGRRRARLGGDLDGMEQGFLAALTAARLSLDEALGSLSELARVRLREALTVYVRHLLEQARAGWTEMTHVLSLSDDEQRSWLADAAFGVRPSGLLGCLAEALDLDLERPMVAVVSLHDPIPAALLGADHALRRESVYEVLVPASWTDELLAAELTGPAVTGPPTSLADAPGALVLARRAAALLRESDIDVAPGVVSCTDHLGDLLVRSNRLLADLIMRKHLAALAALPVTRRLRLGEITLHSLESGLPVNQLARRLGIPTQTAHSRLNTARSIMGDVLDDPTQRLELIVALRAALPRWRDEVA